MTNWFCKNLGDAMLAYNELEKIKELFSLRYNKKSISDDMAIFMRHESECRLQCEVKLYLSPKLEDFAYEVGAIVCKKPLPHSLGLLLGHEKSKKLLF